MLRIKVEKSVDFSNCIKMNVYWKEKCIGSTEGKIEPLIKDNGIKAWADYTVFALNKIKGVNVSKDEVYEKVFESMENYFNPRKKSLVDKIVDECLK
jgi:hypothetical protein